MTIIEALQKGSIRLQFGLRHMSWDGEKWSVYKKFRGRITPLFEGTEEEAVEVLLNGTNEKRD